MSKKIYTWEDLVEFANFTECNMTGWYTETEYNNYCDEIRIIPTELMEDCTEDEYPDPGTQVIRYEKVTREEEFEKDGRSYVCRGDIFTKIRKEMKEYDNIDELYIVEE